MRRYLGLLALCGLLIFAGCADADIDLEENPLEENPLEDEATPSPTPTDDGPVEIPDGTLEVHTINVGQADATVIRTDNETMLIDTGDWRDDGETVIEYLEHLGIDRIDHLVSTHGHADHIGGNEAIIDHYEENKEGVGAVYDNGVPHTSQTYERYLDAIERHDVDLFEVSDGDEIPFDGVQATVLNPEEPGGDGLHYNSVAVHLQFGESSFLFTGDAERDAEERMVETHGDRLAADVYHAGHHGSDTSSTAEFLDVVDPAVTIISSGYDSQYSHPHTEPLERFSERGIDATWTGVHGTIVFVSDGEEISVRTQHEATTKPEEIRDEPEATAAPTDPVDERFVITQEASNSRLAPHPAGTMRVASP